MHTVNIRNETSTFFKFTCTSSWLDVIFDLGNSIHRVILPISLVEISQWIWDVYPSGCISQWISGPLRFTLPIYVKTFENFLGQDLDNVSLKSVQKRLLYFLEKYQTQQTTRKGRGCTNGFSVYVPVQIQRHNVCACICIKPIQSECYVNRA